MIVVRVLEWFQCKTCGRRHRWRAELAGTEIPCACGAMVFCPELEVFGETPGASDTLLDPAASATRQRPVLEPEVEARFPAEDAGMLEVEGGSGAHAPVSYTKVKGLFGMSRTGEFIFWILAAAVGFTFCVFAAVLWDRYWAIPAGLWGPFSFWKVYRAKDRWQGNRTFSRAVRETLGD